MAETRSPVSTGTADLVTMILSPDALGDTVGDRFVPHANRRDHPRSDREKKQLEYLQFPLRSIREK